MHAKKYILVMLPNPKLIISLCTSAISHVLQRKPYVRDVAYEHGLDGSKSSMALLKALSLTLFRDPMSNCAHTVPQDSPLCEHLLESHTDVYPSVTPAFVTDNFIPSTSNPEHFLTVILSLLPLETLCAFYFCVHRVTTLPCMG